MDIIKIQLSHIDLTDSSYIFTPDGENSLPTSLEHSFKKFGVFHPPIVKEMDNGCYAPVTGRKRVLFVKDYLNSPSCPCLVVPQRVDDLSTWQLALEERLQKGPLTLIETALFLKKVLTACPIDQAANIFLPSLGLQPQAYTIKKILPLADLEEPIQQALHGGRLDGKVASTLCECSFRDRLALFDMIDNLHLSVGYQKKLILLCRELEKRNGEAILSILSQREIKEIIASDANLPQKATNLMKHLTDLASPKLAEARHEFNKFLQSLDLPDNVQLTHSQSFETDALSLTIGFKNRDSFLPYWENQRKLVRKFQK